MRVLQILRKYWEEKEDKNLSAHCADDKQGEIVLREEVGKIGVRDRENWLGKMCREFGERKISDDKRLVERVCRHKVAWQLLDKWEDLGLENTIDRNCLKNICRKTLSKNLAFIAEMHRLNETAIRNGIEIIFYKGAALATEIYGNIGAREFNDIDVLVNGSANAKKLKNILIEKGYHWIDNLSEAQEKSFLELHCEYMLLDPKTNILVEIHWKLFHKYLACEFDMCKVFANAQDIRICGKNFNTLGLVDNFITLAMHHYKHQWTEFRYVCDITGLITEMHAETYRDIINQAKLMGVLRVVLVAFQLSQMVGIRLPRNIQEEIATDRHVRMISANIRKRLIFSDAGYRGYFHEMISLVHVKEKWADRLKFIIGGLLSPSINDYKYIDLPEQLFFLYYLIRPFRQFVKIFKSI